jgi:hypothetical protein
MNFKKYSMYSNLKINVKMSRSELTYNSAVLIKEKKIIEIDVSGTKHYISCVLDHLELPFYLVNDIPINPLKHFTPNQGWSAVLKDFEHIIDFVINVIFPFYNARDMVLNNDDFYRLDTYIRTFIMSLLDRGGVTSCYAIRIDAIRNEGEFPIYNKVEIFSSSPLKEEIKTIQTPFSRVFTLNIINVNKPTKKLKKHFCISNLILAESFKENNIRMKNELHSLCNFYLSFNEEDNLVCSIIELLKKIKVDHDIDLFAEETKKNNTEKEELSIDIMGSYTLMCWTLKQLMFHTF